MHAHNCITCHIKFIDKNISQLSVDVKTFVCVICRKQGQNTVHERPGSPKVQVQCLLNTSCRCNGFAMQTRDEAPSRCCVGTVKHSILFSNFSSMHTGCPQPPNCSGLFVGRLSSFIIVLFGNNIFGCVCEPLQLYQRSRVPPDEKLMRLLFYIFLLWQLALKLKGKLQLVLHAIHCSSFAKFF